MTGTGSRLTGMIIAATIGATLLSSAAQAQSSSGGGPISLFDNFFTGSIAPANRSVPVPPRRSASVQNEPAPAPSSASRGWSGEDGGSGHPLMTAAAIRQAAANFDNCVASMWPDAARRHISQQSFRRFTTGLTPDLRLMDLMDSQPEFTKAIWDYLDILVNDTRLAKGREILAKYKPQFDAVEKAYGVDRYIIASIWGIESNYSTQMGDRSVLNSTATLACVGRRQKYFRDEFLSALEILHHGDVRPDQLRGSWAGAFGPTQFMPTSFKRYAVDADGDGRRDVINNPFDLIASTANNLKKDGWQPGETWGYEVVVPRGFNYMLADRHYSKTLAQWHHLGVTRVAGKAFPRASDTAYLLAPAGAAGAGRGPRRGVRALQTRDRRRTDPETTAAALPPKLTVPMILF
ncbi:lytic murein transglycosylase, partial [Rhodopseudomonas sp. BAL398]|uniref:lytic murein transglycosylase n=1 Tax=Rhodopseudomonas sp. BAL398 TaxID=3034676 RepID=UPI0023E2F360